MAGQLEGRRAQAASTLDLAIKGATVYQREDLTRRLTAAKDMLSTPSVMVYVVGEFKQGKSSLINALLTAQVCPVDDDIATAVPTVVKYAAEPTATATYVRDQDTRVEQIPYEAAAGYAAEGDPRGAEARARGLHAVQIGIQRRLLQDGLVLVDTPGVGGLGSVHSTVTVGALPQAHAVVFCSDASQELTAAEIKFLKTAQELCPTIIFALTKTDLHLEWRRILQLDLAHLERAGVAVEPIALSSELRLQAAKRVDQAMNAESGFPALVARLTEVVADSEQVTLRAVGNHVYSVVDQLEQTVRARQSALVHPERTAQLTRDLTDTRERLERLKARSARWQTLLYDGLADVSSDIDHDLRIRARGVLMDAENAIDEGDPAKNFEEFASWLRQRLAGETMENYAELIRATKDVAERVAEHFELEESAIVVPLRVEAPVAKVDSLEFDTGFAVASKKSATAMAGLQKSYGGLMMFTMLTHIAMLAIPLPIGIAAAALMGRSGMKDDRKRQLEQRRQKAKLAVRRYVDEFNIHVGKDSRDVIRRIQRELRDGYTERLDELLRSLAEALKEAERAVQSEQTEKQQLERIESDLKSLAMLRGQADGLMSGPRAAAA
ncbi:MULTISPECIES: dynamin family protein [Pseudonocardia]|uniref:Dynamin family protein n=1 Tax=Pseudonocardia oroxyli TaxID=366584 RepID=A0A1G7P4G2_PSEOR|nr:MULTISPECIES: dynamin family protein [Pseudonocardia]MCF7552774.1 dynamin family protein [Pseudonocardia sp. WMMC193]SDF81202.1 Dynamin family protein [Pseudonocardia oroxyli]